MGKSKKGEDDDAIRYVQTTTGYSKKRVSKGLKGPESGSGVKGWVGGLESCC